MNAIDTTKLNDTAHQILDAAEKFTQTRGFNAFSYKDLQAEVGVKTSSIHYYFPTKQHLASFMAARYTDRFLKALQEIDARYKSSSERLTAIGQIFVDVAHSDKLCLCGMLTSDLLSLPDDARGELLKFFQDTEVWLAKTIRRGIVDREFRQNIQPEQAAAHLVATLEGAMMISRTRKEAEYMEAILHQSLSYLKETDLKDCDLH